jgi:hypothetical protein
MDIANIKSDESVATILKGWSETTGTFIELKTACVGCYLAHFCTLKEVSEVYDLDLSVFLEKIKEAIQNTNQRSDK